MKQREHTMLRDISIAVILFSATTCFSQTSQVQVKDISSNVSISNEGLEKKPKINLQTEYVGTKPKSLNPDSVHVMPYVPQDEKKAKNTNGNNNTSKPE